MIADGRAIAKVLKDELRGELANVRPLSLAIAVTGTDAVTQSYVGIKKRVGGELGVTVKDIALDDIETTDADGIIVQLPLPQGSDTDAVLNRIPKEKDVDVLTRAALADFEVGTFPALPPVPAAMAYILKNQGFQVEGKKVAIVGFGRLVGRPAKTLFTQLGASVTVADKGDDVAAITREADIVILGTGVAGILQPDMLQEGAAVLDAGASELGGKVVGDADPACADKAGLFTPVPGGVGPVAIAEIYQNLLALAKAHPRS